jgi:hypothetical protein
MWENYVCIYAYFFIHLYTNSFQCHSTLPKPDTKRCFLQLLGLRPSSFQTSALMKNTTPWPEPASELYRPSDRLLSAKLVPTFVDRGCHVVSVTDPYGCILGFLDRSRYIFFEIAPQLYSRGWVDPVPDPLLPRKSDSAGNRTRTSGSVARNSDH